MGNMAKPNLVISVDDAGVVSMKSETTFKTTEIKFKLSEEFEETTADGRKTKVGNPFVSLILKTQHSASDTFLHFLNLFSDYHHF